MLSWRRLFTTDTQQKSHCHPGRKKEAPLERAELCSQTLVRGAGLRPELAHCLFINKVLLEPMYSHSAMYWFHTMAAELESWDRLCESLSLKCLLSGPQRKMSVILALEKGDKDNKACEGGGGSAVGQEEKGGHKGGTKLF